MEDRKIPDLHKAAEDYVDIRDERMGLTKKEVAAKELLHNLMKSHNKTVYRFEDIEARIVVESETVKVTKIKPKKEKKNKKD